MLGHGNMWDADDLVDMGISLALPLCRCAHSMRFDIIVYIIIVLCGVASATLYANCSDLGPTPWPKLCWDDAHAMVRPSSSYSTGSTTMASPFLVSNASFYVPVNWTLMLGHPVQGMGAPNATVEGAFLLESGANLGLVGLTLHVYGNMTLQSGSRLTISDYPSLELFSFHFSK